ncbi:Stk1 family PASTA domain-containing Ser/Thr kinase [Caldibacillus debilis]|uniref:Stk1 family PASTA domain-containing Ser/Thr kinase n=1 Tax=Caldibacillus debilis TaxID=301148 RepID=UPI000EA93315|nr:Stk1 family PASTA domain-containing Ser/Thr kinase [Caldibacillus debilis]
MNELFIGKRINERYKILKLIGGGGMANVYLARDMILERDVAIKILRLDYANDEQFIRRFHREAQSATSLSHPNIVNIYDVGEEDDIYYIVMEYVEGETLKEYIKHRHPLPVETAVDIMKQLAAAVRHAHQNNIIHRDIKPQNILIDKQGNVKITDFGIATALTATTITDTNSVLGSVHYISPEQIKGSQATKKSDIYSLGIVMFELLTGKLPYSGETAVAIALKHLQEDLPSPRRLNPSIPQSVENIVLKATAKDPLYRYANIEELEDDLLTCLDPDRLNEPRFTVPIDEEATKAVPVIPDEGIIQQLQDTKVREPQVKNPEGKTGKNGASAKGKKKKRLRWPHIIAGISAFIILFIIFMLTVYPALFGKHDVTVPEVEGMEYEEAVNRLEDAGLKIGNTYKITHEEIPENHVVKTDPKEGKTVKEGSIIHIFVSTGKEKIVMPDYRNRMYDDVVQLLRDRNFKDIQKNEVFHDSPEGTIIEQDPAPGEEIVPEETVLTFTVSKGEETFKLADLSGYSENALREYAGRYGITIDIAGEEYHDSVAEGLVISQDPKPGTELKKGDKVSVILSKGKEPLPPKTVTVDLTIQYTGNPQQREPQRVQIFIEDMNHSIQEPYETFDITETTRRRIELVIEPGKKGRYKVVIDDQVVTDQEVNYPG